MGLTVRNITKLYDDQVVLDNVSFDIEDNGVVGLIGKNGAGKTTLLKAISGIHTADSGEVQLDGLCSTNSSEYKQKVGYMSEKNPLFEHLYVKEYLEWLGRIHDLKAVGQRINEVVEMTDLLTVAEKKIVQLSKGYRQRVGIAASILHDPRLLILDEPVNGLDPEQIIAYRQLIKSLSRDKIIILSSHLMQEIEAICNRVILLDDRIISKDQKLGSSHVASNQKKWILKLNESLSLDIFQSIDSICHITEKGESTYIIESKKEFNMLRDLNARVFENNRFILGLKEYKENLDQIFE